MTIAFKMNNCWLRGQSQICSFVEKGVGFAKGQFLRLVLVHCE